MFCTKCGNEIKETERICGNCGNPNSKFKEEKIEPEEQKEEKKNNNKEQKVKVEKAEKKEEKEVKDTKEKEKKETAQKKEKTQEVESKKEPINEKAKQNKAKSTGKIFIVIILILVLLGGVGAGAWFWFNRNEEDEESSDNKKSNSIDWGAVYIEILKDEEGRLEDMDNQQIQLLDIDNDNIPELIVYGIKDTTKYIANIYKINEKNEIDTIKLELAKKFDLKLLFNYKEDDYKWYAVTSDTESENELPTVYDLNIVTKTYTPEKVEVDYELEMIESEDEYSKKIDFNKDASEEEKQKVLDEAEDGYVATTDLITDEFKAKVEEGKAVSGLKKINNNRKLVYDKLSLREQYLNCTFPAININSDDVNKINTEIEQKYGFTEQDISDYKNRKEPFKNDLELEEISYDYGRFGNYLYVVVKTGGNSSVWASAYCINLENSTRMTTQDIFKNQNLTESDAISKAKEIANKAFEETISNDKKNIGTDAWKGLEYDGEISKWKSNLEKDIEKFEDVYIDEKGDTCMLTEYSHPGGQWSCTKTIIINITKDSFTELNLNVWSNKPKMPQVTPTPTSTPTPTPVPTTTPAAKTNDDTPSQAKITKDEAMKLAQSVFGDENSEPPVGYLYCGWGTANGKQYYVFDMRWHYETHASYIGTVCVSVDGKSYEQAELPQGGMTNGSQIKLSEGYGGTF